MCVTLEIGSTNFAKYRSHFRSLSIFFSHRFQDQLGAFESSALLPPYSHSKVSQFGKSLLEKNCTTETIDYVMLERLSGGLCSHSSGTQHLSQDRESSCCLYNQIYHLELITKVLSLPMSSPPTKLSFTHSFAHTQIFFS